MRWSALVQALRRVGTAVLVGLVLVSMTLSWRWPVVNDAALMHYVVFLAQHGRVPYVSIHDINLPGAYLPDWVVMRLHGGDVGWRLYDLGLLGIAAAAMMLIARRQDWFAGVFAGGLLALFHGRDGMGQAGQRDLAMAVLFLVAVACLLEALWSGERAPRRLAGLTREESLLFGGFGLALGAATTVKPFGVIFLAVLLGGTVFWRRSEHRQAAVGAALAGFAAPLAVAGVWLLREHALGSFVAMCRLSLPYHAADARPPFWGLVRGAFPASLLKLGGLALAVMLMRRSWRLRQTQVLLAGIGLGLVCFFAQQKGYGYQRYPYAGFWLLWVGLEFTAALQAREVLLRALGCVGLLFGVFGCGPSYLRAVAHAGWQETYLRAIELDLRAAGGDALNGRVQCVDSISGCVNVLYRMRLEQATGTLYDEFLFPSKPGAALPAAVERARRQFMGEIAARPPQVFVVASWLFPVGPGNYRKLGEWQEFREYLDGNYQVADERVFTRSENGPLGFRVYVRK